MKKILLYLLVSALLGSVQMNAQTLKLSTYGVSPRDVERDSIENYFNRRYSGLTNVGNETKVYLKGVFEDSMLTSPAWNFLEKPAGSAAEFGLTKNPDNSTQLITFIPDVTGRYVIRFSDGTAADTLAVNSALYLGVASNFPSCIDCHNTEATGYKYDKWLGTNHAHSLETGLNGDKGSHFNESCVKCHSTGYDPDADNQGFDDWLFVFPDTLMPGMYDSLMNVYPDAMARANVQCEQCHGPGSSHYGNKFNIARSMSEETCNYCHNAGTKHVIGEQWLYSGEDASEFDGRGFEGGHGKGTYVARGSSAGCAPCHSGAGQVEWVKEGRPVNEYGLPAAVSSVPETTKHTCATCHDPHDASNEHQLRFADMQLGDGTPVTMQLYGTGATCMQCHRARVNAPTYAEDPVNASSHYGPHHGPQADLLLASNHPVFRDENGDEIHFPSSPHAVAVLPGHDEGDACVNCHMGGDAKVDADGNVILLGGHSWNMSDPEGNDFVEACNPCHGSFGGSFKDKKYYLNGNADLDGNGVAEGLQPEVKGLMEQLALLLPPVGENEVQVLPDDSTLTPSIMKSAYAYIWVEEDRSFGIHNPAFTTALLYAAIREMGGVVNVSDAESDLPADFNLSQNYPNPFNPATIIEYSLPEQSHVNITIYDALGNEVENLFNGDSNAGVYKVHWNASRFASGIYFYRITAGKFMQVKKMLLLK